MCLSSLDEKMKKHKYGYKVFRHLTESVFTTPIIYGGAYLLRKTYNALELSAFTKTLPVINATDGSKYKAGFHYYLKLRDAKCECAQNEAVVRVKVKNILATGSQFDFEAGVCETITLDRIMYSRHKKNKEFNATFEQLIGDCFSTLIDDVKSYSQNPSDETLKSFENHMKNFSLFWKFVIISDSSERNSIFFKTSTKMWWKICKENWHPTVKKNYYKIMNVLDSSNIKHPRISRIAKEFYGHDRYNIDDLILDS